MSKKQPNPSDVIIGNNIRRLRIDRGMTQEKLGEILGITFQQIQKYEKGTNRVSGSKLDMLCTALQCSLMDVFAGTAAAGGAASAAPSVSSQAMKVAMAYDRITSRETKAAILRIINVVTVEAEAAPTPEEEAAQDEELTDIAA